MEVKIMVNAIIAAICSLIIPGLGQAIAGDLKRGIIFFVLAIVMGLLAALVFKQWLVYIINIAIAVFAAYDAYLMGD